jgi:Glycosyl hydrolase family 115/Glycosyl hydrolase family 67 N-terminus
MSRNLIARCNSWTSIKAVILVCVVLDWLALRPACAIGQFQYVSSQFTDGAVTLASNRVVASIYVDTNDFWGVARAAGDLQADLGRVTGLVPSIIHDEKQQDAPTIVIGTLGKSRLIDQLAKDGKLDVSRIAGKWESFVVQVVENALVIAGSDKRGTIYGIYDLSEQIGVSPWYWWTDVPVRHRDGLFAAPGVFVQGPPVVKYRGIFLNDEAPDLTGWAKEKFGGYNPVVIGRLIASGLSVTPSGGGTSFRAAACQL